MKTSSLSKVSAFFSSPCSNSSKLDIKVAAAEATFVFHTVKHAHSYNSADCSSSLFSTMFSDSKTAGEFKCARTKCTRIALKVLGKQSQNIIINDITSNNLPYSVATDASNKGNIKMFPLVLRNFLKTEGTKTKLLSFYECAEEKSVTIANSMIEKLKPTGINVNQIIAFGADNSNVNFGRHQSVYTELKKTNSNILGMGCLCHVLSNFIRNAQSVLHFDFEYIIIKIFNEFSSHTKRVEHLKEFYEFCDISYSDILRNVPTRWLSLVPAVERLYRNFEPIKSYFNSDGQPPSSTVVNIFK